MNKGWAAVVTPECKVVTEKILNLKNTLMNGQCFNWKEVSVKSDSQNEIHFYGCINKNFVVLKEDCGEIYFKFLVKDELDKDENEVIQKYFQLDIDTDNILKEIHNSQKIPQSLKDVMLKYPGIRILKQDLFECIISFITSANNNIKRITNLLNLFKSSYGKIIYRDDTYGDINTFPDFDHLSTADLTEKQLKELGFGYRAKYIVNTVKFIHDNGGSQWLESVKFCENPSEKLLKLPGIGRKVADCISLFSLGHNHIVPLDIHMINFYNESVVQLDSHFKKIVNLGKASYLEASQNLRKIFGDYAGWIHSVFYIDRIDKTSTIRHPKKKKSKANINGKRLPEEEENEEGRISKVKCKKLKK